MAKHRVLIVYDVPGWAYHRRAMALQKHAPDDFEVFICPNRMVPFPGIQTRKFDLIFELDYFQARMWQRYREKLGLDFPLIVSFNKDHNSKVLEFEVAVAAADIVIVNNRLRYDRCTYRNVVNISNGVDTETFKPITHVADRPRVALYAGSTSTKKGKNYHPVLVPLAEELKRHGVQCRYLPVDHAPSPDLLDANQMAWWYNTGQVILCASSSEGTPNILLEGMACGCVPVTTWVGNVPEFAKDRENCVICKPTVQDFLEGVLYAVEHAERLSQGALDAIKQGGWSWAERSRYFFALFRKVIQEGPLSVSRVSYMDGTPEELFGSP